MEVDKNRELADKITWGFEAIYFQTNHASRLQLLHLVILRDFVYEFVGNPDLLSQDKLAAGASRDDITANIKLGLYDPALVEDFKNCKIPSQLDKSHAPSHWPWQYKKETGYNWWDYRSRVKNLHFLPTFCKEIGVAVPLNASPEEIKESVDIDVNDQDVEPYVQGGREDNDEAVQGGLEDNDAEDGALSEPDAQEERKGAEQKDTGPENVVKDKHGIVLFLVLLVFNTFNHI